MVETTTTSSSGDAITGDRHPSVVDVLIAARRLIEKPENWGKGRRHFDRPIGTCCMAEAVEETVPAAKDGMLRQKAFASLYGVADLKDEWGSLTGWNDARERTHTEVLAAFDRAIEAERAKVQS